MKFDFYALVRKRQAEGQRYGQAVFNVAWNVWPDVAMKAKDEGIDPFNDDSKADEFMGFVLSHVTDIEFDEEE